MADDDIRDQRREALLKELRVIRPALMEVEKSLVAGRHEKLGALAIGEGMSADEIQAAVEECGRTLCAHPKGTQWQYTVRRRGSPSD